jgi:uncharacterized repeat protein (TIGR03803 family)
MLTSLASFNGTSGKYPQAALIADGQDNFYGTTSNGGSSSYGTIFELSPVATKTMARRGFSPRPSMAP